MKKHTTFGLINFILVAYLLIVNWAIAQTPYSITQQLPDIVLNDSIPYTFIHSFDTTGAYKLNHAQYEAWFLYNGRPLLDISGDEYNAWLVYKTELYGKTAAILLLEDLSTGLEINFSSALVVFDNTGQQYWLTRFIAHKEKIHEESMLMNVVLRNNRVVVYCGFMPGMVSSFNEKLIWEIKANDVQPTYYE